MRRYGPLVARTYDLLSGEPVYRQGRRLALAALPRRSAARILDVGCGTGLNLPGLVAVAGPHGQVVGLDRSVAMLEMARRRVATRGWHQVRLVQGDAADVDALAEAADAAAGGGFDAVILTYTLSLIPDVDAVWRAVTRVLVPGAAVAVVDLARPTGRASWATPAARLACWLGGSDIEARPWELVERELTATRAWSRCGGHVQVRVGTWR